MFGSVIGNFSIALRAEKRLFRKRSTQSNAYGQSIIFEKNNPLHVQDCSSTANRIKLTNSVIHSSERYQTLYVEPLSMKSTNP
eukprot:858819-Karenia_brevis.AAC.1